MGMRQVHVRAQLGSGEGRLKIPYSKFSHAPTTGNASLTKPPRPADKRPATLAGCVVRRLAKGL